MDSEIERCVASAVAAANAGDVRAFLDCFEDEATVDDLGRTFVGRQALSTWVDREFIGLGVSLDVRDATISGVTATITADVEGVGLSGTRRLTFIVPSSLIREMIITA